MKEEVRILGLRDGSCYQGLREGKGNVSDGLNSPRGVWVLAACQEIQIVSGG